MLTCGIQAKMLVCLWNVGLEKPPSIFNFVLAFTPFNNPNTTKDQNITLQDRQVPHGFVDEQDVPRLVPWQLNNLLQQLNKYMLCPQSEQIQQLSKLPQIPRQQELKKLSKMCLLYLLQKLVNPKFLLM